MARISRPRMRLGNRTFNIVADQRASSAFSMRRPLGFANFVGNQQYITTGNLAENDLAFLFLMDYPNQRRVKIWGRARVVEDDPELVARPMPEG